MDMPQTEPQSTPSDDGLARNKRPRKSDSEAKVVLPGRVGGSYQRTKAPSACLVRPICGFCRRTNGDCRYTESERSRFDPASIAILQQLDEIKVLLQARAPSPGDRDRGDWLPQQTGDVRDAAARSMSAGNLSETASSGGQKHGGGSYIACAGSSDAPGFVRHATVMSDAQDTRHTFDRYAARLQTTSDVPISSAVMAHTTQDMGIEAMLSWPVLRRQLTRLDLSADVPLLAAVGGWARPPSSSPDELAGRLDHEQVHELVNNFLANNNLKNPIFEPSDLRQRADEFAERPLEQSGRACLMFLVLAISCLSAPIDNATRGRVQVHQSDSAYRLAEVYFHEAQQRAGALVYEVALLAAQCHFLTGVYLMHTLRIVPAWKAFVQAGTDCVAYFLSGRRAATDPVLRSEQEAKGLPLTSTTRALEDALYWSCLKSEVELRLELGLPGSGITSVHYPHVFPCVPDVDMGDDQEASPQPALDREQLTSGWFFFLAEIALKRLTYNILQARYGQTGEPGKTESSGRAADGYADEYECQLEHWMRLLPAAMQFPAASSEPLHDILPWVLRGHYIDAVEMLRFPAFAAVFSPRPAPAEDGRLGSVDSVQYQHMQEYLQNAVHRIEANADGLFHRHQGSWLAVRSCTRSALALMCVQLASQDGQSATGLSLDKLLPPRWEGAVQLVLAMLQAWAAESPDVACLREVVEGLYSLCL